MLWTADAPCISPRPQPRTSVFAAAVTVLGALSGRRRPSPHPPLHHPTPQPPQRHGQQLPPHHRRRRAAGRVALRLRLALWRLRLFRFAPRGVHALPLPRRPAPVLPPHPPRGLRLQPRQGAARAALRWHDDTPRSLRRAAGGAPPGPRTAAGALAAEAPPVSPGLRLSPCIRSPSPPQGAANGGKKQKRSDDWDSL